MSDTPAVHTTTLRTPWRAVAAAFALNGVLLGTWASRIPAVMQSTGLGEGQFGLLLLVMGVGALISFPLAGRLSDRRGAAPVTRTIALGYLLSLLMLGLAPTAVWLAAAIFVFGLTHGSMDVTMNSWATEVEARMGRSVMASFHAMWSLGAGLGAAAGAGATALGFSVGVHFLLAALVFGAVFLWLIWIDWESPTRPHDPDAPAFALPRGALVLVGLMALASGAGEGAVADWSAVFLASDIGAGEAQAALGLTAFSVAMVATRLTADRLITRYGPVAVARVSGCLAFLGVLLVVTAGAVPQALAGFAFMGLGYAAIIPLAFSRAARDPKVPPGQAIAAVATLGYSALLLAPPAIGFVAEATSLRFGLCIVAGLALLIPTLAGVLRR